MNNPSVNLIIGQLLNLLQSQQIPNINAASSRDQFQIMLSNAFENNSRSISSPMAGDMGLEEMVHPNSPADDDDVGPLFENSQNGQTGNEQQDPSLQAPTGSETDSAPSATTSTSTKAKGKKGRPKKAEKKETNIFLYAEIKDKERLGLWRSNEESCRNVMSLVLEMMGNRIVQGKTYNATINQEFVVKGKDELKNKVQLPDNASEVLKAGIEKDAEEIAKEFLSHRVTTALHCLGIKRGQTARGWGKRFVSNYELLPMTSGEDPFLLLGKYLKHEEAGRKKKRTFSESGLAGENQRPQPPRIEDATDEFDRR